VDDALAVLPISIAGRLADVEGLASMVVGSLCPQFLLESRPGQVHAFGMRALPLSLWLRFELERHHRLLAMRPERFGTASFDHHRHNPTT